MSTENKKTLDYLTYKNANKKLCNLLFRNKDILHNVDDIDIHFNRINLVSKVYSKIHNEHVVFLCSFSYANKSRLCEIVMGALSSIQIRCSCDFEYDFEFVDYMRTFIQSHHNIYVHIENNILSLRNNSKFLLLADLGDTDRASQFSLCRSLCILLAMCGKIVHNNLDDIVLNDYGITNSFERVENENATEN